MSKLIASIFWVYRRVVSPHLAPSCRFYPTCSAYAEEALQRHGMVRGSVLAVRRLSKCRPFGPHGVDPVPGNVKR